MGQNTTGMAASAIGGPAQGNYAPPPEECVSKPLFNPALPTKTYGIWNGRCKLGEVNAPNVHEALRAGEKEWGVAARVAILKLPGEPEAMFIA